MFLDAVVTSPEWFEYLKPVLTAVVSVLAPALAIFLTYLAKRLIDRWEKKTGLEIDAVQQGRIRQKILEGVALGEQTALKALKMKEDPPDGAKKLAIAVGYVKNSLGEMGYSNIPEDKIKDWVEILLAQMFKESPGLDSSEAEIKAITRLSNIPAPEGHSAFYLNGSSS